MKATMYINYPARSLLRGGQRSALALFCVAVGVMAIVGLQLTGGMVKGALVGNARAINGGDLSVRGVNLFADRDLAYFDDLKSQNLITNYTATYEDNTQVTKAEGGRLGIQYLVVDPKVYPFVATPALDQGGDFRAVLGTPGNAVVSKSLFDVLGGQLGKTLQFSAGIDSRQLDVKIAGVMADGSILGQGDVLYLSFDTFKAAGQGPVGYSAIYATTPSAEAADRAKTLAEAKFAGSQVQTADGLLKQLEDSVKQLNNFLVIVGLLALLIGGVGIINTMQVLLARRRVEIAMLKTTGYQRRDLYLLFGLEAAMLGLFGGIVGALAGIGVAAAIRALFSRAFGLVLAFTIDPTIVVGGVAVGLATALIFGLIPIVQAAGVRPTAVLREMPEGRTWISILGSIGLVLILSILFAILASVIIGNVLLGIGAVYGAFILLGFLSIGFGLLVFVIGYLPVPERYSIPYLAVVTVGVVISALITIVPALRGVGILLLLATLAGYAVVLMPREWKISTKMAFRNLGRARGRNTTTLLALFIGVFAVGLVLVLGQGIRETISGFIAQQLRYNVIALAQRKDAAAVNAALDKQGADIERREQAEVALQTRPTTLRGQPIEEVIAGFDPQGQGQPAQVYVLYLTGLQGYDLANGKSPTVGVRPEEINDTLGNAGRSLNAGDAGTNNVIVDASLRGGPTRMKVGDKFTQINQFSGQSAEFTVVGFYKATGTGISINLNAAPVLGSLEAARAIGGQATLTVWYLQVDAAKATRVVDALAEAVPAAQAVNFADLVAQFGQVLNNLLLMLTAIASLALFAGIVIIANAVALAMLERRRELGIMKSVGYTSTRVLGVVLIENGLIGGLGGLLAMMLVAIATAIFNLVLKADIGVNVVTTIGMIAGVAIVAMLVAALVAWSATRVRPLEVLRYE
ncbi:MAG: FtsX-like permease family protein [Thermomicrobiales bacterium]